MSCVDTFKELSSSTVRLSFPNYMFGRRKIMKQLESKLNNTKSIKSVVLKGAPGSGKSRIIREFQATAIKRRFLFAKWNAHSYKQVGSIFEGFELIISQIIQQILAGNKHELANWRTTMYSFVKADMSILFPHIPELRTLLGSKYSYIKSKKIHSHSSSVHADVTKKTS
ncbi:unnamed protein product [Ambrosiozyma monospora]|uniref:Unnamed protein product n=1 Tax=Ambrosiozyma monospora TaxID=43982 RepID=A0ACB5TVC7_AMBMO|nr:unnamed protein product [Ambrosiozyma monospora]